MEMDVSLVLSASLKARSCIPILDSFLAPQHLYNEDLHLSATLQRVSVHLSQLHATVQTVLPNPALHWKDES